MLHIFMFNLCTFYRLILQFFVAESEQEVFKHCELHAREAHGEDPAQWSEEELQTVKNLIRRTEGPGVSPS